MMSSDFQRFASSEKGISPLTINRYSDAIGTRVAAATRHAEGGMAISPVGIFERMLEDRIIILGTEIDDTVAGILQAEFLYLTAQDRKAEISLYINSPGGVVSSGLGIYDVMNYIEPDVCTTCTGMAASMAAVLLCAGASGKRSALEHSRVMIHQPLGGVSGQAADILIAANEIQRYRETLSQIISDHTGKDYQTVFEDSDRNFWMTAPEAKEYGILDFVLTPRKRKEQDPLEDIEL